MRVKNPKWHEQEILLVLDFYFDYYRNKNISEKSNEIKKLSDKIRSLNLFETYEIDDYDKFRNTSSVHLKLRNLKFIDTNGIDGLEGGSKLDRSLFERYKNNQKLLKQNIITFHFTKTNHFPSDFMDELTATTEGKVFYTEHLTRERDNNIVSEKKRKALTLKKCKCEICGFDFFEKYGNLGYGFIECHHKTPIGDNSIGERMTNVNDLALVCSNCHSMLHRAGLKLSVDALTEIVQINAGIEL
ncbi:MAG: HNH endonuclease [Fibrobacter sp.]|nr:HNH endonuclease [Fibrobacter sp.]